MSLTIALTRFDEPAWLVKATLDSLARQRGVTARVLYLEQRTGDEELIEYCRGLSHSQIRFSPLRIPRRSLSFARNTAIEHAATATLLFIDSDAVADPDWALELQRSLSLPEVGLAGGRIVPIWHERPLWIARAHVVLDQYSMYDLGSGERPVHRVVGASFGLNLLRLGELARFDERLGRREGKLFGGEESKLCRTVKSAGMEILYNGRSLVQHQVLADRIRYRWVLRRMYYAGVARARVGGAPNPSTKMGWRDYAVLPLVLPFYLPGYIHGRLLAARD